jgi:flagellar biosynthetic protein FlhB/type III secretion protein U
MAGGSDSGDKTEKPTPKKLQDARKKGDVSKSKEVTSTVVLILWLGLGALAVTYAAARFAALWDMLFVTIGQGWETTGFAGAARDIGAKAAELAVMLVAMLLVPVAAVGTLADFLQIGPVLAFEKIKPNLEHLNPVEGFKRMFSMDNVIEVVKALVKTALLFVVGWLLVKSALPEIVMLARAPDASAQVLSGFIWSLTLKLMAWTVALFAGLSLLDAAYQNYSFMKKMRMSMRDIKQEMKESEGDPHIKGKRRQMAQEWSQSNAAQAARGAAALVVNPTHIAIAIDYDRELNPVPTIAAKGEGHIARAMRQAAEEAGVPIVRNIPLARDLLKRGEIGEIIPADLFDIIAEVILWAREVRAEVQAQRNNEPAPADAEPRRRLATPGEDLTQYQESPWNRSQ